MELCRGDREGLAPRRNVYNYSYEVSFLEVRTLFSLFDWGVIVYSLPERPPVALALLLGAADHDGVEGRAVDDPHGARGNGCAGSLLSLVHWFP